MKRSGNELSGCQSIENTTQEKATAVRATRVHDSMATQVDPKPHLARCPFERALGSLGLKRNDACLIKPWQHRQTAEEQQAALITAYVSHTSNQVACCIYSGARKVAHISSIRIQCVSPRELDHPGMRVRSRVVTILTSTGAVDQQAVAQYNSQGALAGMNVCFYACLLCITLITQQPQASLTS